MPKIHLSGSVEPAPLSARDLNSMLAQRTAHSNSDHSWLLTDCGLVETGVKDAGGSSKAPTTAQTVSKSDNYDEEDDYAIWDDCNDVRRKIRAHLAAGNKVTHFLRDIGGINSNSYRRFMAATGPNGGQENGCFSAAYCFFEKKRIAENKPKTAKRKRNEETFPAGGHDTGKERKHVWVCVGRN